MTFWSRDFSRAKVAKIGPNRCYTSTHCLDGPLLLSFLEKCRSVFTNAWRAATKAEQLSLSCRCAAPVIDPKNRFTIVSFHDSWSMRLGCAARTVMDSLFVFFCWIWAPFFLACFTLTRRNLGAADFAFDSPLTPPNRFAARQFRASTRTSVRPEKNPSLPSIASRPAAIFWKFRASQSAVFPERGDCDFSHLGNSRFNNWTSAGRSVPFRLATQKINRGTKNSARSAANFGRGAAKARRFRC